MTTAPPIDRAVALLDPPRSPVRTRDGYADLLPGTTPPRPSIAQRAMRSTLVPVIYERAWRPVLFRAWTGRSTDAEERELLEAVAPQPGDIALDVACGPGNTTRRLARAIGDGLVVGFDLSETMLRRAVLDTPVESAERVAYVRGDAGRLPFADGSFDIVSCYGALYLVDEPFAVVDELVRMLAPGGRVAILTTCDRGPAPLRWAGRLAGPVVGLRQFGRDAFTERFRDAGLVDVRQRVSAFSQTVSARRPA